MHRAREFVLHTPHEGARTYLPNTSPAGGPKSAVVAARVLVGDRARTPASNRTPPGRAPSGVGSPRKRFLHAIRRVTVGKLCMSASTLVGSRAAPAIAVRYVYLRHISGPVAGERVPPAAHRSHLARLLACTATAYAMTFLHGTVTERWITWQARDITIESRERCGARALFPVNGLAEFTANADGAITAEGDNLAVWCKAGAEMIFGHVAAPEPATPAAGQKSLTDRTFLRRALAAAERHWHLTARRDVRGGTGDALGRWNHASAAALALVETYTVGQATDPRRGLRPGHRPGYPRRPGRPAHPVPARPAGPAQRTPAC
ncbi:hypothetical protein ABZ915_01270 [Streptomyces sp. NPDC046915]|uniref:hypothetical protein n=1 Tax=Streptomyces sp. NPDC046915 TaxID=3155257 RepID=UPI0033F0A1EC